MRTKRRNEKSFLASFFSFGPSHTHKFLAFSQRHPGFYILHPIHSSLPRHTFIHNNTFRRQGRNQVRSTIPRFSPLSRLLSLLRGVQQFSNDHFDLEAKRVANNDNKALYLFSSTSIHLFPAIYSQHHFLDSSPQNAFLDCQTPAPLPKLLHTLHPTQN